MWPKFGQCSIFPRGDAIIIIFRKFVEKNRFSQNWFLLKFNNFGLVVAMNMQITVDVTNS